MQSILIQNCAMIELNQHRFTLKLTYMQSKLIETIAFTFILNYRYSHIHTKLAQSFFCSLKKTLFNEYFSSFYGYVRSIFRLNLPIVNDTIQIWVNFIRLVSRVFFLFEKNIVPYKSCLIYLCKIIDWRKHYI